MPGDDRNIIISKEYISEEVISKYDKFLYDSIVKSDSTLDADEIQYRIRGAHHSNTVAKVLRYIDQLPDSQKSDELIYRVVNEPDFSSNFTKLFLPTVKVQRNDVINFAKESSSMGYLKPQADLKSALSKHYDNQEIVDEQLRIARETDIPVSELLDENGVAALVLGNLLKPEAKEYGYKHYLNADDPAYAKKSSKESYEGYLHDHFFTPSREKEWGFSYTAGMARKDASDAADELRKGNAQPAVSAMEQAFRQTSIIALNSTALYSQTYVLYGYSLMALNALEKPEFKAHVTLTQEELQRAEYIKAAVKLENRAVQSKAAVCNAYLNAVASGAKTVSDSPEYSKALKTYLTDNVTNSYFKKCKQVFSSVSNDTPRELTDMERLAVIAPDVFRDSVSDYMEKTEKFKSIMSGPVTAKALQDLDVPQGALIPPVMPDLQKKLEKDFYGTLSRTTQFDPLKALTDLDSVKGISKKDLKPFKESIQDLVSFEEERKKKLEGLNMAAFEKKIRAIQAAKDGLIAKVPNIEEYAVLNELSNVIDQTADKLNKNREEEKEFDDFKLIVRTNLLQKQFSVRIRNQQNALKDLVEQIKPDPTDDYEPLIEEDKAELEAKKTAKAQASHKISNVLADMMVSKVMSNILEKGKGFMTKEDLDVFNDEKVFKKSLDDMMGSSGFADTVKALDYRRLSVISNAAPKNDADEIDADFTSLDGDPVDELYEDLLRNVHGKDAVLPKKTEVRKAKNMEEDSKQLEEFVLSMNGGLFK